MKTKNILKAIAILVVNAINAQDVQLTQFFATPTVVNPAFAGVNACSKFAFVHRNQWRDVPKAYQTYVATYDHYFSRKNFGMNATVSSDFAGTGNLRNNYIGTSLAYEAVINYYSSFRFAIQPGIGIKSVDFSKLYFGDQIVRGGNVTTIENMPSKRNYFDIGAGMLYTNRNFWIGTSVAHLNKPNESFYDNSYEYLPVKYSAQVGSRFLLNSDERDEKLQRTIYGIMLYKAQQKFDQVDVGLYYNQNIVSIGLWYRGIPVLKAYQKGYQNNDAVALILGLSMDKYKIGYSYDLTISELTHRSGGAHEITVSYQMCTPKKKKTKRNNKVVFCPKF